MRRSALARSRQIHVGVVGAGFAGLRCADILLQHGCKVTILEARNRLGGRVAQSNHLGHSVDLGPNWIHGTEHNPILTLAQETGTPLHTWSEEQAVFDTSGQLLPSDDAEHYNELLWDQGLIDQAFKYSKENCDSIEPGTSLHDFFVEKADTLFLEDPADVALRKRATFLHFASLWGCYIGSPVTQQSLKFFWLEECIEGANPYVAGTYERILEKVVEPARRGAEIVLECEAVGFRSGDAITSVSPSVNFADGTSRSFDEVVVTTPLGWLKENKTAFQPELPTRLSEAIEHISYGHLDKVYITFPTAFWDISEKEHANLTDAIGSSGTGLTAPAAMYPLHQISYAHDRKHYPSFVHWLSPTYAPSSNPKRWGQEAMNLAALSGECAHPTLLFYIQGPQSKLIASLVTSAKSDEERDAQLIKWFQPYYSLLPHYSSHKSECQPLAILATAWAADKFAGYGSYSNFQVGLKKGDEDIEVMRRGIPERCIWLAGEHTAPFVALGTSTGAYLSGESVGKRIAEAYGLTSNGG